MHRQPFVGLQQRLSETGHQAGAFCQFSQHADTGMRHETLPISRDFHTTSTDDTLHFEGALWTRRLWRFDTPILTCQSGILTYLRP